MRLSEESSTLPFLSHQSLFSIIEEECKKLKIKVNKTGSLENFNRALSRMKKERRKAENVLMDDIEVDMI
jgi:hypothetical protein